MEEPLRVMRMAEGLGGGRVGMEEGCRLNKSACKGKKKVYIY